MNRYWKGHFASLWKIFEIVKNSLAFFAVFRVRGFAIAYSSFLNCGLNEAPQE